MQESSAGSEERLLDRAERPEREARLGPRCHFFLCGALAANALRSVSVSLAQPLNMVCTEFSICQLLARSLTKCAIAHPNS